MSGYILCQTQKAKIPYYIENISTNVYSLEELCYYFYHNLYLVDETILNEQLCRWLQEELELPETGSKASLRCLTRNLQYGRVSVSGVQGDQLSHLRRNEEL